MSPSERCTQDPSSPAHSCVCIQTRFQVKQAVFLDCAEAARKKAADAAAAAAAAAELRPFHGQSNDEATGVSMTPDCYNHTGADESPKLRSGGGRPGPGGGGGGVSRVIGAAESAERDKYGAEKRNQVRLATPNSGTEASGAGMNLCSGAKTSPAQRRAGLSEQALSPIEKVYCSKPCAVHEIIAAAAYYIHSIFVLYCRSIFHRTIATRAYFPRCSNLSQGLASKFCPPVAGFCSSSRGTLATPFGLRCGRCSCASLRW
jgi:hypothetical protein